MIAMALPAAGRASDGRISFVGAVTTPTCTLNVSDVGSSLIVKGLSKEGGMTLTVPAAAGIYFSMRAADCGGAIGASRIGTAPLVSIYFESVNSVDQEPVGVISLRYN
jgi:type 1 fimbria pilin